MITLHQWATRWGIGLEAFRDLQMVLGAYTPPLPREAEGYGKSEAWAQSVVRLEASRKGVKLFRNNVGALMPKDSKRLVRFGLANESEQINDVIKSGDLIGWRPIVIQPQHVGYKIAQFTSREIKEPGWQYTGADREPAQLAWASLVVADGGDACFATGEGTI